MRPWDIKFGSPWHRLLKTAVFFNTKVNELTRSSVIQFASSAFEIISNTIALMASSLVKHNVVNSDVRLVVGTSNSFKEKLKRKLKLFNRSSDMPGEINTLKWLFGVKVNSAFSQACPACSAVLLHSKYCCHGTLQNERKIVYFCPSLVGLY